MNIGSDSVGFLLACASEVVVVNVKPNPRSGLGEPEGTYPTSSQMFNVDFYKGHSVNTWIDGFKALLVEFKFL
jgi:hypothetical protein